MINQCDGHCRAQGFATAQGEAVAVFQGSGRGKRLLIQQRFMFASLNGGNTAGVAAPAENKLHRIRITSFCGAL